MTATVEAQKVGSVFAVPVDELHPNPSNPRTEFFDMEELRDSIAEFGVIVPLLIERRPNGKLLIVAGERRWRASKMAKRTHVPCIIVGALQADDRFLRAMTENLQRANMSPTDEARAVRAMLRAGETPASVSAKLHRSPTWVSDRLALLTLPPDVQRGVDEKTINLGEAKTLAKTVKRSGTGSVTHGGDRCKPHFTVAHPLHGAARSLCDRSGHPVAGRIKSNGTTGACAACWESVIRDDALANVVPIESQPADLISQVVAGVRDGRSLSADERERAVLTMHADGFTATVIGDRVGLTGDGVERIISDATTAAQVPVIGVA